MTTPLAGLVSGARRDLELSWAREEERELELTEAERYARDPLGWIDDFCVIASKFSSTGRVQPVRMTLYPDQRLTIASFIALEELAETGQLRLGNVVIEKSRQIGETWALAAVVRWLLAYHPARGLYRHQREADVIDRDWSVDSFLGKVRYIDEHLDRARVPGLSPLEFRPVSAGIATITNPGRGGAIRGECKRDDTGRGQTLDYAIVDEAAHVEHAEAVHASLDDACPEGKIYLSTPKGDGTMHARLSDATPQGWTCLRLHWSRHPVYGEGLHVAGEASDCALCEGTRQAVRWQPQDPRAHRYPGRLTSPWYERAIIGKTDEQVARELDIDRAGALSGRVYAEFSREVHVCPDGVPYEEALHAKLELGWDFGLDCTAIVVCQDAPTEYRVIGYLRRGDLLRTTATPEAVAEALVQHLRELGVPERFLTKEWLRKIHAVGDPAGQSRSSETAMPFVYAYRRLGFSIGRPQWRYCRSTQPGISSVKRLLLGQPKSLRVCGVNAADFADDLANNTWPTDAAGSRRLGATRPLDDLHNHGADAFRYLVVSKWPPPSAGDEGTPVAGEEDSPEPEPEFRTRAERYGRGQRERAVALRPDMSL